MLVSCYTGTAIGHPNFEVKRTNFLIMRLLYLRRLFKARPARIHALKLENPPSVNHHYATNGDSNLYHHDQNLALYAHNRTSAKLSTNSRDTILAWVQSYAFTHICIPTLDPRRAPWETLRGGTSQIFEENVNYGTLVSLKMI